MELNKTILMVNMEGMESFSRFMDEFESKGFHLISVDSIDEAYKVLAKHSIDIIAIDLDSGYQKAFEFCYNVKHNKNLAHIFIIGFSSAHAKFNIYLSTRTKEEKKWLNMDLLVPKPISPKNVYRLIKKEIAILDHVNPVELDTSIDYM